VTGRSLVQRSPTECGVSECDLEISTMRRHWPTRNWCATNKQTNKMYAYTYLVPLSLYVASSHQNLKLIPSWCVLETLRRTLQSWGYGICSSDHGFNWKYNQFYRYIVGWKTLSCLCEWRKWTENISMDDINIFRTQGQNKQEMKWYTKCIIVK
jgi:hypothetical protein